MTNLVTTKHFWSRLDFGQRGDPTVGKALIPSCKARYAVLFQIRTFPPEPEDEAHIGPTATYDKAICPGFPTRYHNITDTGYNISYNRHTTASNTIQQRKINV